jgi:hypothetical protein
MRARYMVKCALRTGEIRWHVSVLFLREGGWVGVEGVEFFFGGVGG